MIVFTVYVDVECIYIPTIQKPPCISPLAKGIDMNVLALLPSALIGALGGLMGAAFVFCNLKIVRTRRAILAR